MRFLICALALSFGVAYADIPANVINQTHDGATINAGTYFNTSGAETKFINTAGTGITLNAGSNIRGAEVFNNALTGNGGNIHIQAPDQVVRLNGNIDVRGFLKPNQPGPFSNLAPIGDGGNVTVDAAFLFQNGNIYASGANGGNVQLNVGGMTMGPNSRIDTSGSGWTWSPQDNPGFQVFQYGTGGSVNVASTGVVNVPTSSYIISDNIVIQGQGVNMNGVLHAGAAAGSAMNYTPGGVISLVSTGTDNDINIGSGAIIQTHGGQISINSQHDINQGGLLLSKGGGTWLSPEQTNVSSGIQGNVGGNFH